MTTLPYGKVALTLQEYCPFIQASKLHAIIDELCRGISGVFPDGETVVQSPVIVCRVWIQCSFVSGCSQNGNYQTVVIALIEGTSNVSSPNSKILYGRHFHGAVLTCKNA